MEIQCPECSRRFRVPEKYAGKRVKCPKCEGTIGIPAAGGPPSEEPIPGDQPAVKQTDSEGSAAERWYLQTEDGQQFGPASKSELDDWFAEGRIDASCQLLCEGWEQWKWADEVFPDLAEAAKETQQAAVASEENPFAGIGEVAQPIQQEVNPYVSPREVSGGIDVGLGPGDGGEITARMRMALAQTRPWVLFLSILGFIFGGLMVLFALVMVGLGAAMGGAAFGAAQALICLLGSAFYLVPSYYLFRYGQQIGRFLRNTRAYELEGALTAQKSFWKLLGILTLVVMALYAVLIVVMVAAGIAVSG